MACRGTAIEGTQKSARFETEEVICDHSAKQSRDSRFLLQQEHGRGGQCGQVVTRALMLLQLLRMWGLKARDEMNAMYR